MISSVQSNTNENIMLQTFCFSKCKGQTENDSEYDP